MADQARAVRAVPAGHGLLRRPRAIDRAAVEAELAPDSNRGVGRPSWPPAVRLRMLVLEQFTDLSDREVHEPDDTTLVKFRARVGPEGIRKSFDALNRQWAAAGLVWDARRVVDGVHLWAQVARRSLVALLRQGRAVVIEAVAGVDPARAPALQAAYVPPAGDPEPRGEEALRVESERTGPLLAAVADLAEEPVQARVAQVQTLLAGESAQGVSCDDPDARRGHTAPDKPFCGYKAHEALDPASRLITAVDVVPGNANEAVRTDALLATEPPPRAAGASVIAAGLYNNATTVGQVEAAQARPDFGGLQAERVSDGFAYDGGADQMVCPAGKRSIGKVRVDNGDLYYFSMRDCKVCPRNAECLTRGEREGKAERRGRVYLSDGRKRKVTAGEAGHAWRTAPLKLQGRIEPKFDAQMNRHDLRRARCWGLTKVPVQVLLNAITVDAKRAVKLLAQAGRASGAAGTPAEATT